MHTNRKYIHVGGHSRRAHRFGVLQIGFGGTNGLFRGFQAVGRQDRPIVGPNYSGDDLHLRAPLLFGAQLSRKSGRFQAIAGLARIVYRLIDRKHRLEVVDGGWPIERADVEVIRPELVLG